jgi:glycosyltransferase involved in cell wall biosynthesis
MLGDVRIGAAFEPTAAAYYRGVYPLEAMTRRGHEVVWPVLDSGEAKLGEFDSCDVIYVFRRSEEPLRRALAALAQRGVAIVWDSDDDLSSVPKLAPNYKRNGGLNGRRRFAETVRMARLATVMTTTSETIRARYEEAGVARIEVIENHLPRRTRRRRERHDGLIVGWIAGMEHQEDAVRLDLREILTRIQARHADVLVETVGVDLKLGDRYVRHAAVHFDRLPFHMARYDIGLAPLVDIPFNAARSNIKVKEYAASGVPWLASPRAPYRALGEDQGGLLVDDEDWERALEELVRDRRLRRKLAKSGARWARSQTIDAAAARWEYVFQTAVAHAAPTRAAS